MKQILAFLLFMASPAMASFSGYTYQKKVNIPSSQVSNVLGVLTNFPAVFISTDVVFSTSTSGGHMTGQYDLIASTLSDCSLKLFVDTETVENGVLGSTLTAWVNIPQLTTATLQAATYYWCYGNSSITSYQGNSTGTWANGFEGVYHFPNNSSFLVDSTSNSYNLSNLGASNVPGKIGAGFAGGCAAVSPTISNLTKNGSCTNSIWFNTTDIESNQAMFSGGAGVDELFSDPVSFFWAGGNIGAPVDPPYGVWHLFEGVFDNSSGTVYLYIDGQLSTSVSEGIGDFGTITSFYLGCRNGSGLQFVGSGDELRLSTTARSSDWIFTEYKNQNSPATFMPIGPELMAPPPPPTNFQGNSKFRGKMKII